MTEEDDPVARNRSVHPRRTPDRTPLGDRTLRRVMMVATATVAVATVALLFVVLR